MTQTEAPFQNYQGENMHAPTVSGPVQDDEFAGIQDTYSFGGTVTYTLPDGKQWIAFKVLNEGEKAQYQRLTNRDIKINRKTEEAAFRPDAAADRHALILTAVTNWHLATKDPSSGKWSWLTFNDAMLRNWLKITDPKVVEKLEAEIRKANPG